MNPSSSPGSAPTHKPSSLADKLLWLLKGFIYPIWSRPYYRAAAAKPFGAALVFLVGFALLRSAVGTISVAINLNQVKQEIETAYHKGEIPHISIRGGIAAVSGSGRYFMTNKRQIIGVDTTGATQEINTDFYSEGLLLTRDELHFLNNNGYQVLPLNDLNRAFGDPIILDAASVTGFWSTFSVIINILVLGGGFLFFSVGRFIYLALLGLMVWGAVSINDKNFDFAKVLITGIYANVPTTYLIFSLRKIGIGFFGFREIILFAFWGIALVYILKMEAANPQGHAGSQIGSTTDP